MDYLKELGSLALASRMKRTVDTLRQEVKIIYQENHVNFDVSLMSLMKLVEQEGEVEINEASNLLGISQPAVTQFCNKLVSLKLVDLRLPKNDHRKKKIRLSKKGKEEIRKLNRIWKSMSAILNEMLTSSEHNLLESLSSFEFELKKQSFHQRIADHLSELNTSLEIIDFEDSLSDHFKTLNYEWIKKHFFVEDSDEYLLSNPKEAIIDPGGFIYFARYDGEVVGTTALIKVSDGVYEIGKMAVSENYQKKGIGRKLIKHVLKKSRELNFKKLILYSNTNLAPAINMYFNEGFRVITKEDHHNKRSNIKMQLVL